ncbi:ABC transporter permease subunit [Thermomonospora umbrina]|uniref:ABC-2 family transporter n=1 Tax=Thermomonospora umbrina TaxID=111806 RepID=A0A3D9SV57_9ACTN|nr:ABC transporter permease subunit [Thermomonospora umbrina]REE99849.1 hypothetical protein DFJ69_5366 [Thermomonospora umbrina]
MIWLTWRQFRASAAVTAVALAALAAVLAITRPGIADRHSAAVAACGRSSDCERIVEDFFYDHQLGWFALIAVVLLLPALVGLFWGAPLIAGELESGTHRLVWNQSVTRVRWLAVKLVVTGAATVTVAGLASLVATWWSEPLDKAAVEHFTRMSPLLFDTRGIAPIGYAAFAFVLGVTVGLLVRRTVPAMAVTLAVFAVVQIAMPMLVRPHLMSPVRMNTPITVDNMAGLQAKGPDAPLKVTVKAPDPDAWVLSNETLNASGRTVGTLPAHLTNGACRPPAERPPANPSEVTGRPGPPQGCFDAIKKLGYRQRVTYQPSTRYWAFQGIETGIYAVLTVGLVGFCVWWIRRRIS